MNKEETAQYHHEQLEKVKSLLFIQKGRINRLDYFFTNFCINALDKTMNYGAGIKTLEWAFTAISIFTLYIYVSITAQRLRDIGISGWFTLPILVVEIVLLILITETFSFSKNPYAWTASLVTLIVIFATLIFWPGQKHDNKYGAYDPIGIFKSPKKK